MGILTWGDTVFPLQLDELDWKEITFKATQKLEIGNLEGESMVRSICDVYKVVRENSSTEHNLGIFPTKKKVCEEKGNNSSK